MSAPTSVAIINDLGTLLCRACAVAGFERHEVNPEGWQAVRADQLYRLMMAHRVDAVKAFRYNFPDLVDLDPGTVVDLLTAPYCDKCGLRLDGGGE